MVHDEGAEHDLSDRAIFLVIAGLSEAAMRAPNANGTIHVTGDHARAIGAERDVADGGLVQQLVFSRPTLVLIPKRDAAIAPTNSERLEGGMPSEDDRCDITARNLEVV